MKLSPQIIDLILSADGKALASSGERLNVIPVSSIKIVGDEIWLINYFMHKTLDNILQNPEVVLACWKGFSGYQIHASARYHTEGEELEVAKQWIAEILPERVVLGLLILTPRKIFDVSASKECAGQEITA